MYKVGDQDTTPDYVVEECDAMSPRGFMCTLDATKHPDVHVAGGFYEIVDVWPVSPE